MLLLFGFSVCFSTDVNNLGLKQVHLLYRHGAHDYVLNTLGVFNGLAPPYASLVMFELLYLDG